MKIKRLASIFLAAALAVSAALAVGVSADTDTPEVFTDSLTDMTKVYQKDGTFQCDSNTNLLLYGHRPGRDDDAISILDLESKRRSQS